MLLLTLLAAVLLLPFLGKRHLWTSAEARVAQVARQMLEGESWIVPRLGDNERLKKPPLAYWLTAVAALPFGDVDEFNSRIPNVLSCLGVMLLVYLLARDIAGRSAGLLAGAAIGTTATVWWQSRTTGIEAPLLFFNTLALFGWWRYHTARTDDGEARRPLSWLSVCYLALALSFMQKGPVGPSVVLLTVLAYLAVCGIWKPLAGVLLTAAAFGLGGWVAANPLALGPSLTGAGAPVWLRGMEPETVAFLVGGGALAAVVTAGLLGWLLRCGGGRAILHHCVGLLVFCAIIVPWPILVVMEMPEAWDVWYREFFGRLPGFDHKKPWHYFIVRVLGDGQPWVFPALLAPLAMLGSERVERRKLGFPLAWSIVMLIFFSIPTSKKSYYIMPIYPALAILAAVTLVAVQQRTLPTAQKAMRWLLFACGGVVLLAGVAAYPIFLVAEHMRIHTQEVNFSEVYSQHTLLVVLSAAAIALAHGTSLILLARQRRFTCAAWATVLAAMAAFCIHIYILPFRNEEKGDKQVCGYLKDQLRPDDEVYTYGISGMPIFSYYLNHPVERIADYLQVQQVIDAEVPHQTYMLIGERDRQRFECTYLIRAALPLDTPELPTRLAGLHGDLLRRLQADDNVLVAGAWRPAWAGEAFAFRDGDQAVLAEVIVVQISEPEMVEGKKKKRWRPQKAKVYLDALLAETQHWQLPQSERLLHMGHPKQLNGSAWFRAVHSPFHNRPVEDYLVKPAGDVGE